MILEQFVEIIITKNNRYRYMDKGYELDISSDYVDENGKTKKVWFALVHIDDILPSARNISLTRICDKCGKIEEIYPINKRDLCYDCGHPNPSHHQMCSNCGKDLGHWNKDVKLCRECWREQNKGETHPSYGKSWHDLRANKENTHKYKIRKWRTQVKERDNYTCKICGKTDEKIVAHHLYDKRNFPDKIYDLDNGVTMCNYCHMWFHSRHQHMKPVTPQDFEMFLKEVKHG